MPALANTGNFTVDFWAKWPGGGTDTDGEFFNGDLSAGKLRVFQEDGAIKLVIGGFNDDVETPGSDDASFRKDGQWHHISVWKANTSVFHCHVDGVPTSNGVSKAIGSTNISAASGGSKIGHADEYWGGYYWPGATRNVNLNLEYSI